MNRTETQRKRLVFISSGLFSALSARFESRTHFADGDQLSLHLINACQRLMLTTGRPLTASCTWRWSPRLFAADRQKKLVFRWEALGGTSIDTLSSGTNGVVFYTSIPLKAEQEPDLFRSHVTTGLHVKPRRTDKSARLSSTLLRPRPPCDR